MLVELPRLFGGDSQEGERLLQRAVALDPDDPRTRLMLANVLRTSGERDQALAHVTIALGILEHEGSARELADARDLVGSLALNGPRVLRRPPEHRSIVGAINIHRTDGDIR
jgi:hypothetical protein